MSESADIVDVFAAPASPRLRRERPALIAARLAWAPVRVATDRGRLSTPAVGIVASIGVGDRVHVEIVPHTWATGLVEAWETDPLPHARIAVPVAAVRLDPFPDDATAPPDFKGGDLVRRPRRKIVLITEYA